MAGQVIQTQGFSFIWNLPFYSKDLYSFNTPKWIGMQDLQKNRTPKHKNGRTQTMLSCLGDLLGVRWLFTATFSRSGTEQSDLPTMSPNLAGGILRAKSSTSRKNFSNTVTEGSQKCLNHQLIEQEPDCVTWPQTAGKDGTVAGSLELTLVPWSWAKDCVGQGWKANETKD